MAPVLVTRDEQWVTADGTVVPGLDPFVSGLDAEGVARHGTPPTAENAGCRPGVALTPYTGPNAGGVLTISTPGATYTNIDFGNTRIIVSAPDVAFMNCRWTITDPGDRSFAIDFRSANNTGGGYLGFCEVENVCQRPLGTTGVGGWNLTIERSKIWGFVDDCGFYPPGSPGDGPLGVIVLDSWLGPMAFFAHPSGGVVHSSDTKTHNDNIQLQGGHSWRVVNTTIWARYSEAVGTGTPGSGSEYVGGNGYTQAQGEAARYEIVEGSGEFSPGQPGALLGGSIAGIMVTPASGKGVQQHAEIAYCRGGGGSAWLNAGSSSLASLETFGTVKGLRLLDDQRLQGRGILVRSGVAVTTSDNSYSSGEPDWPADGAAMTRRTG